MFPFALLQKDMVQLAPRSETKEDETAANLYASTHTKRVEALMKALGHDMFDIDVLFDTQTVLSLRDTVPWTATLQSIIFTLSRYRQEKGRHFAVYQKELEQATGIPDRPKANIFRRKGRSASIPHETEAVLLGLLTEVDAEYEELRLLSTIDTEGCNFLDTENCVIRWGEGLGATTEFISCDLAEKARDLSDHRGIIWRTGDREPLPKTTFFRICREARKSARAMGINVHCRRRK